MSDFVMGGDMLHRNDMSCTEIEDTVEDLIAELTETRAALVRYPETARTLGWLDPKQAALLREALTRIANERGFRGAAVIAQEALTAASQEGAR